MADAKPVRVGEDNIPDSLKRGKPAPNLDRDQHILIRRSSEDYPSDKDMDDGPDVDPETKEYRRATYKLPSGNVRRDW